MAAFTTAAIIGSAIIGAGATAYQVNEQKRAADAQAKAMKEQERRAKLEAAQQAALANTDKETTIKLGRGESSGAAGAGAATSRNPGASTRVGGLGSSLTGSASRKIGL